MVGLTAQTLKYECSLFQSIRAIVLIDKELASLGFFSICIVYIIAAPVAAVLRGYQLHLLLIVYL